MIDELSFRFVFSGIVGACIGSWAACSASRLIAGASLFAPSRCDQCHRALCWYELIPLISWIASRGVCSTCGAALSWVLLISELTGFMCGCVLMTVYPLAQWVWNMLWIVHPLLVTMITDGTRYLIFDGVTRWMIPPILVGALCGLSPVPFGESLAGALTGGGLLWAMQYLYYRFRNREGIGDGDIELLAYLGSCFGPLGVWAILALASISALCCVAVDLCTHALHIRNTHDCIFHERVPFGTFLAGAGLVWLCYGHRLLAIFSL